MLRLHHLALGARDVEAVAAFYRDRLGLPEISRQLSPEGSLCSVWLDLGGAILMLEHTGEPARRVAGVGAGPFLLALAAAPHELGDLERRLAEAGIPVESRTAYTSYFRDPEGNRVGISSYPIPGTTT